jgi:hypothetical protein
VQPISPAILYPVAVKLAAVAMIACATGAACSASDPCGNGGGDPRAACLVQSKIEITYHALEPHITELESALAADLAKQPMRCGHVESAFGDPVFADAQAALRELAHDGQFAGVAVAIQCGMQALLVVTAGVQPSTFTGVGTKLGGRDVSWGKFDGLPPPALGLSVESDVPLPHDQRARVTWLFTIADQK